MAGAQPLGGGPDFEQLALRREGALQRTAHLLTGNVYAAQDLVQNTLAKLYRRWDRIRDVDDVDAYARRVLVNEFRTAWRRPGRRGELLVEVVPDRPAPGAPSYDGSREAVWRFVVLAAAQAARGGRAALLRTADRGRDRRPDGHLGRHRDVAEQPRARLAAGVAARPSGAHRRPHHREGGPDDRRGPADADPDRGRRDAPTTRPRRRRPSPPARARSPTHAAVRRPSPPRPRPCVVAGGWAVVSAGPRSRDRPGAPTATPRPVRGRCRDLPQGAGPRVAYLEGDAFVTATRRAGHRAGVPHGHDRGHVRRPACWWPGRTTTQRPFASISLVSGGSTRRLGCGTPTVRGGERRPGVLAVATAAGSSARARLFHADDESRRRRRA